MIFKFVFTSFSKLFIGEFISIYRTFVSLSYSLRCFIGLYTPYYNVILNY